MATAVTRLHGRFAICAVPGAGTLNLIDWEMEIRTEFADGTAHGDLWDVPIPLKMLWTARAKGYYVPGTPGSVPNTTYLSPWSVATGGGAADLAAITFTAYKTYGSVVNNDRFFVGTGYLTRGQITFPMAMVEQEVELRGTGLPTLVST